MQTIRPTSANIASQMLDTVVKSESSNSPLRKLLGIGSKPATVRYLTSQEVASMGYMSHARGSPYASLKHVSSAASALTRGAGQTRTKFTLVDAANFKQLKSQRQLEFVGLHGTARFAADAIAKEGINHDLVGKHTGNISGGGRGLYTANSNHASSPDQAADGLKTANHYARRAGLTGADAADNKSPTILAIFRAPVEHLKSENMPSKIQGDANAVEAFRKQHPAHEYTLGPTPLPRRLAGVNATTTLITDNALEDEEIEYFALEFKPEEK